MPFQAPSGSEKKNNNNMGEALKIRYTSLNTIHSNRILKPHVDSFHIRYFTYIHSKSKPACCSEKKCKAFPFLLFFKSYSRHNCFHISSFLWNGYLGHPLSPIPISALDDFSWQGDSKLD